MKRLAAAAKWASPAVVLVEVVLVITGKLGAGRAVVIGLALEALLALTVASLVASAFRDYRRERRSGANGREAAKGAVRQVLPSPVAAIMWRELELFIDIADRARGREAVTAGQRAIPYWRQQRTLLGVMGVLSVGEIVLLGLVLPWEPLRLLALILGLYGTLWIFGFYCATRNRPHVLDDDGWLELRCANLGKVRVRLSDVAAVSQSMRSASSRSIGIEGGIVSVTLSGTTLVSLTLRPGATVEVKGSPAAASQVCFSCDDPAGAVEAVSVAVRQHG